MDAQAEFEELRRESESWWYTTRRKFLREAAAQALRGRSEARVLDLGCTAQLEFDDPSLYRACNVASFPETLAFRQIEGDRTWFARARKNSRSCRILRRHRCRRRAAVGP